MNYLFTLFPMLAAMGASSPIAPRQEDWDGTQTGGIFCEARLQPNWADCRNIMSGNGYFGEGTNPDMSVCVIPRECRIWTRGNCRISFCNNENYEVCDSASGWGGRARAIEDGCAEDTGGYQSPAPPADWSEVAIRLNTEWRLMSTATATSYKEITVEENKAELQSLVAEIAAASEVNELESRQADRFSDVVTSYNIYMPGSAVFVAQVPNNGAYTVSEAKSETFSITASASLGASAWDAVSAEIGVSAGFSTTMTSTTSVTINIDCPGGTGQVYWRPFFDSYVGTLESDGRRVTIYVPKDTDASRMNYDYQCTG
ncbi:hypothetical protein J4E91_001776 [Alternaria rosae]|nr:hypothetical protein J4E91_001776 [Alternaria rosae]